MSPDNRGLNDAELARISTQFYSGCYDERDILRVIETAYVQRRVLKDLFNLFYQESPLRRDYVANPIRGSTLAHLKELVAMEDSR